MSPFVHPNARPIDVNATVPGAVEFARQCVCRGNGDRTAGSADAKLSETHHDLAPQTPDSSRGLHPPLLSR
jgi:hypothetical protein